MFNKITKSALIALAFGFSQSASAGLSLTGGTLYQYQCYVNGQTQTGWTTSTEYLSQARSECGAIGGAFSAKAIE